LLDRGYAAGLMKNYDPNKATPSEGLAAGDPAGNPAGARGKSALVRPANVESNERPSSASSMPRATPSPTPTRSRGFGSGVTIAGTGILMNNEMDDFTARLGEKYVRLLQGPANSIAPQAALSSMMPTLVTKDGSSCWLRVVRAADDHQHRPRDYHQRDRSRPAGHAGGGGSAFPSPWIPDVLTYERFGFSPDVIALLSAKGQYSGSAPARTAVIRRRRNGHDRSEDQSSTRRRGPPEIDAKASDIEAAPLSPILSSERSEESMDSRHLSRREVATGFFAALRMTD